MDREQVNQALKEFRDYVIRESKKNLTRSKKNYTYQLYKSLKGSYKVSKNSFEMSFSMEDWGLYQDRGVSGKQKKYNTPYKYTNKKPPMEPLMEWAKRKRFRLRNEKGQYVKGNYKTIGFILQKHIYNKGIKPSLFFTKPFEKAYKRFPSEIVEKYGIEATELFRITVENARI
jgi:hypothetical protein